ncbi:hypothetical protein RclHR1_02320001 [Rhizophagus clarus]|uniref:Uncharacterized protein n=1 Tax=Rhizophagus clarus TaxID=94130 RepID=A0A2Z6RPR8_9GLOM|nr:hypothetical protein RclHR1_02320001 [Rhizophagus clarus]GES85872.1 hypothetical protein GLOIN_2v1548287 [Rhizophagus clarus]
MYQNNNPSHTNFYLSSNDDCFMREQSTYNTCNDLKSTFFSNDACVPSYTTTTTDYKPSIPSDVHNDLMPSFPAYEQHHNVNEQNSIQISQNLNLIPNVNNDSQLNNSNVYSFNIPGFEIIVSVRPNNDLDTQNQLQDHATYWNPSIAHQEFQQHQHHLQFSQFQTSPDLNFNNLNELVPITDNDINY